MLRASVISALAVMWSSPAWAAQGTPFDVSVNVGNNIQIAVEVSMPASRRPRAIVVVSPGSGGLSDPYFSIELRKASYDPDQRGGLTSRLNAAGFATAYYNQRGYRRLRDCVSGRNVVERARSFVSNCIDSKIRSTVDLFTITSDTVRIFRALRTDSRTRDLPQIALTYSEGTHHVAQLIERSEIDPVGIVAVGGPIDSLQRTARFQIQREFFLDRTERAFRNCQRDRLTVEDICTCGHIADWGDHKSAVREAIGGDFIMRGEIPVRRKYWTDFYLTVQTKLERAKPGESISGEFLGMPIPTAWSARFQSEFIQATKPIVRSLDAYHGPVIFLWGSEDHLLRTDSAAACSFTQEISEWTPGACEVEVMYGLGHGLEDSSGLPPERALSRIVDAVNRAAAGGRASLPTP